MPEKTNELRQRTTIGEEIKDGMCRQEQIEIDEVKEKNWNLSSSMKALRKNQKNAPNSGKSESYSHCTSTVAAA
ncbi:hypothetical protein RJ641_027305 [Dillenia turbinata]|uniref:Uncharacterized protein n=1 Tax=Dillenia turbinata TaxID=194707 RepID=A0AAN8ZPI8_9MAGN